VRSGRRAGRRSRSATWAKTGSREAPWLWCVVRFARGARRGREQGEVLRRRFRFFLGRLFCRIRHANSSASQV
jgi:hypothetical protein